MRKIIVLVVLCFLALNIILFGKMEEVETIGESEEPRMTLIAPFANQSYWGSVAEGFTEAGKELGVSTKCIGFTKMDVKKQVAAMKSAIYAKVDGIVTAGTEESEEFRQVLREAREAGIPVVLVDSDVEDADHICYIGTDNYESGKIAAEDMIAATGGRANIAVVVSTLEVENQKERLKGFRDSLESYPEMQIVKILEGSSDSRILNEHISRMLEEENDLTAVFCAEGYGTTSICQIIKDAKGEYDYLAVVGFGVSEMKNESIEEGILYSTIEQNSYEMGYRALDVLKRAMQQEEIPLLDYTEIKSIQKDNLKEMNLDEGKGVQWQIY